MYYLCFAGEEAVTVIEFPTTKRLDFPNANREDRLSIF